MPIAYKIEMESSADSELRLQAYYQENCGIGDKGCKYLAQGCWPNLTVIFLSKISLMQVITLFQTEDAIIYAKCNVAD